MNSIVIGLAICYSKRPGMSKGEALQGNHTRNRPYVSAETIVFWCRLIGTIMNTLTLHKLLATRALFHRKHRGLLHRIYLFGAT